MAGNNNLTPAELVISFLDAVEQRNFAAAKRHLSSTEFSYHGPIDHFDNRDDFIADIARLETILKRIERRRLFCDGDEVCIIVTYVTTVEDIASTRAAHWVRVHDGTIVSIEGFLDARAYARMFDPEL